MEPDDPGSHPDKEETRPSPRSEPERGAREAYSPPPREEKPPEPSNSWAGAAALAVFVTAMFLMSRRPDMPAQAVVAPPADSPAPIAESDLNGMIQVQDAVDPGLPSVADVASADLGGPRAADNLVPLGGAPAPAQGAAGTMGPSEWILAFKLATCRASQIDEMLLDGAARGPIALDQTGILQVPLAKDKPHHGAMKLHGPGTQYEVDFDIDATGQLTQRFVRNSRVLGTIQTQLNDLSLLKRVRCAANCGNNLGQ